MKEELREVVRWCVAPLESEQPGGVDLKARTIDSGGSAKLWHEIITVFKDTRTDDWNRIYQSGLTLLREESKDFYALWAVLYPMPIVRKLGLEGVEAGLEICTSFLGDKLWDTAYPSLPDGLRARESVFSRLVRSWGLALKRLNLKEQDPSLLVSALASTELFETCLEKRFPESQRPLLTDLLQLLRAGVAASEPAQGEDSSTLPIDSSSDSEDSGTAQPDGSMPTATDSRDELEAAYLAATKLVDRDPVAAIDRMSAAVEREPRRSGRFRGRVCLGDIYLRAGHTKLARQLMEILDKERLDMNLEDWEPELCGLLWATWHRSISSSGDERAQKTTEKLDELFAQVCCADAKQAVSLQDS
ncbi:MAG: hypothetical protein GY946_23665 [bacterium]|nr:hypothetical protein [bacterium]